jgi:hypothetical protein
MKAKKKELTVTNISDLGVDVSPEQSYFLLNYHHQEMLVLLLSLLMNWLINLKMKRR